MCHLVVIVGFAQMANQRFGKVTYTSTLRQSLYMNGASDRINNMDVYFTETISAFFVHSSFNLSNETMAMYEKYTLV